MLQEPVDHRHHADVLGEARHFGPETAGTPDNEVHLHAGLAGLVELLDHGRIHQSVHLEAEIGGSPLPGVADLPLDALPQPGAQAQGAHNQAVVASRPGVAREEVKKGGQVLSDLGAGGQDAQVGVEAAGLLIVIASTEVAVALEARRFLAQHEAGLAVGLEAGEAIDDVDASLLQATRPGDVGLLVEAGPQLDDGRDLLAPLRRQFQGRRNGAALRHAVQGHLDGEDFGILGSLTHEAHDRLIEALVRVVEKDVLPGHGLKDGPRRLELGDR